MKYNTSREDILQKDFLAIDLGSGLKAHKRKEQGFVTLDHLDLPDIDIVCDLNQGLSFLPDNSVDEIRSANVLEHVENLELVMREIHRVLKPGGKKYIAVPHFSNPYYYSDPTHKNFFGLYSFYYYSKNQQDIKRKTPHYYFEEQFDVVEIKLTFFSLIPFLRPGAKLFGWLVNRSRLMQEVYEWYFSRLFPCYGINVILRAVK